MSIRRNGLKAVGLSLMAVCGFMLFMAAGAQAQWLIEKVGLKKGSSETLSAKAHTTGILTIAKKNIEIRCTTLAASALSLKGNEAEAGEKVVAEGTVEFNECKTFSPIGAGAKEVANCKPLEQPIKAGGKALVILHSSKNYILFEPAAEGGKFTTLKFSELCALVETSDITGTLVAECGQLNGSSVFVGEDCNVEAASHLLQTAPAALFSTDTLKFGANEATVGGIAFVELSGANKGKKWAGHV